MCSDRGSILLMTRCRALATALPYTYLLVSTGKMTLPLRFLQHARKAERCYPSLNVAGEHRQTGLPCGSTP